MAYFSHSGNTQIIANQIHENVGSSIFEIVTVDQYPNNYNEIVKQAKQEQESGYKPTLKTKIENIESYEVVFIGYPNWWVRYPGRLQRFCRNTIFRKKRCTVLHARGKLSGAKRYGYHKALPAVNHSRWSCSPGQRRKKCAE